MPSHSLHRARLERWKKRYERSHQRLSMLIRAIGDEEKDWAPDDGIPDITENLRSICSGRAALMRVLRGENAAAGNAGRRESSGDFDALVSAIERSHRTIVNWFAEHIGNDVATGDAKDDDHEEAIFVCLDLEAVKTSAISSLVLLIDPERSGALMR